MASSKQTLRQQQKNLQQQLVQNQQQQLVILNDIKNNNSTIDKDELASANALALGSTANTNGSHGNGSKSPVNGQIDNKNVSNANNNSLSGKKKNVNPYKWLMEEFEDKNLDKVKRTLLVTLDDISKGFSKPREINRKLMWLTFTRRRFSNNSKLSIAQIRCKFVANSAELAKIKQNVDKSN